MGRSVASVNTTARKRHSNEDKVTTQTWESRKKRGRQKSKKGEVREGRNERQ